MSHLEPSHEFDFQRIAAHPWLADALLLEETASTNDEALAIGRQPDARTPLLVLAKRQTRGRGRGGNQWHSSAGALTCSLLLDAGHVQLPTSDWPRVALWTGLAVVRAVREIASGQRLQLKWPNDVYLNGAKLGGILVEAVIGPQPRLVIGVGLNVNNSVGDLASTLTRPAVSLIEHFRATFSLTEVLVALLTEMATVLEDLPRQEASLLRQWRELCLLTGRTIEVDIGQRRIRGLCQGIDDRGALCIETSAGLHRCYTGVVVNVEN